MKTVLGGVCEERSGGRDPAERKRKTGGARGKGILAVHGAKEYWR